MKIFGRRSNVFENSGQETPDPLCNDCAIPLQDTQLWGMTFSTCYIWARPSHKLKQCQECLETVDATDTIYNLTYFEPFFSYCGKPLPTTSSPSSTTPQPTSEIKKREIEETGADFARLSGRQLNTPDEPLPIPLPSSGSTNTSVTNLANTGGDLSVVPVYEVLILGGVGLIFLVIFVGIALVKISLKKIALSRYTMKLQERALAEQEHIETKAQLHGDTLPNRELGGVTIVEMDGRGAEAKELEGEWSRVELPAKEVAGAELNGRSGIKRKPVPVRPSRGPEEEKVGVCAEIEIDTH